MFKPSYQPDPTPFLDLTGQEPDEVLELSIDRGPVINGKRTYVVHINGLEGACFRACRITGIAVHINLNNPMHRLIGNYTEVVEE